jgi:hypothetical protein
VLEGLLEYERAGRKSAAVTKARKRAENYLLERRMLRSLRTGKVIDKRWLRFSFPTFWHYDLLRGLLRFESGRVLVFHGGVFECSSRMNGKPSSPLLRGLGASDGARLLEHVKKSIIELTHHLLAEASCP